MIPNETEFKRVGVLPGEQVKMSFDEDSLGFLADVLINLYGDKELAVIREYSTNARDSHIEAGVDRPIEITTPSNLSFFFKIKDYGIGLSKQDIIDIYSKYGASTKRNTDKQNGMLGLGCKSALTYTDQFTISAVKDNVKINVAISRAEDGGGTMTILSETQTIDENGVEIIVPVTRNNGFANKCYKFFQYWDESHVLINGRPPEKANLTKITDRIFLKENMSYNDKPVLVMGGVSYEISQDQIMLPDNLVAFVDIGTVSFQPSREYLHYTSKTIAALTALKEEYKANLVKTIQADIDKQTTNLGAVKVYLQWRQKLRSQDLTIDESDFKYKDKQLKNKFKFNARWAQGRPFDQWAYEFDLPALEKSVIVYNFDKDKLTAHQRQKLNLWADENYPASRWFYFCVKVPGDGWLDDIKKVDWNDIVAIKIPRRGAGTVKTESTYEMYTKGACQTVKEFDVTKPILHSTKADWKKLTGEGWKIDRALPEVQFAFIGENRKRKFLELYPSAVPLRSGLRQLVQDFIQGLTDQQKVFLATSEYELGRYSGLDKTRLNDPDLVAIIESSQNKDEIIKFQKTWDNLCSMSWDLNLTNMASMFSQKNTAAWIEERYPILLAIINRVPYNQRDKKSYWDHVYLYINCAYAVFANKGV